MRKLVLLSLITFGVEMITSCTKEYSSYQQDPKYGSITITPKNSKLTKVKQIVWKVGPLFKQSVSKGFLMELSFPQLENSDFKHLLSSNKINSWLVEIEKETIMGNESIGFVQIPIYATTKRAKTIYNYRQIKSGFIRVLYHAAIPSSRFENFQCPAFGHDYILEGPGMIEKKRPTEKLVVSPVYERELTQTVEPFSLVPIALSGGTTLTGKYIAKIALYDGPNKTIRSNFLQLENEIVINKESHKKITGCENFEIPPKPEEIKKNFKWQK